MVGTAGGDESDEGERRDERHAGLRHGERTYTALRWSSRLQLATTPRAATVSPMRPRKNLIDLESAALTEARRLLDEADDLERRVTELRAQAALRVRQASRLAAEREDAARREGGVYEGELRVAAGTILPCGEFRFTGK